MGQFGLYSISAVEKVIEMIFKGKIYGEQGSVLMESVLLLPVVLLVFMAAAQFSHILFARQIVEYAAYSGARAGRLGSADTILSNASNAAMQICSIISLTAPQGVASSPMSLPWLGEIAGSGSLKDKLSVECVETAGESVACTVQMDFPLVVPVVREFVAGLIRFTDVGEDAMLEEPAASPDYAVVLPGDTFPHIRIRRSAIAAKPWQCAD